jgi:hypothetical protein
MPEYDTSKLANLGRNVAQDYARWIKSTERMMTEINAALEAGLNVRQIEQALLGRCADREAMLNVLSTLSAKVKMGDLDQEFEDVASAGVIARRV